MKKFLFVFFYCLISFQSFAIEINQEFLNQFNGIALKTIRKSETLHSKSSQREIHGVKEIANILGEDRKVFNIEIIYLDDNSETSDSTTAIWYNSRPERKNGDYRLKYKKLNSTLLMKEGDIVLLGRIDENKLKLVITEKNSKYASKLLNLLQDNSNQEILQEKDSVYSNISNLKEYEDLKIYKNIDTNKIVIVGKATKIKDGDTLVISDLFNVRMLGIDAPESKQLCKNKNGKPYRCGEKATEYLKRLIGKQNITCVNNGNEKYGRFLFVCKNSKHEDINREMVMNGWAVAYYSDLYKEEEQYARKNKLGIWDGSFQIPSEWRKQNKKR